MSKRKKNYYNTEYAKRARKRARERELGRERKTIDLEEVFLTKYIYKSLLYLLVLILLSGLDVYLLRLFFNSSSNQLLVSLALLVVSLIGLMLLYSLWKLKEEMKAARRNGMFK